MKFRPLLWIALACGPMSLHPTAAEPAEALSPEQREKALSVLRAGLHSEDSEHFWVAMHAAEGLTLSGHGTEVIPVLEKRLATDSDAQHRCGLARELVRAGERKYVSVLTEVLTSPDPYGHIHAAESLYKVSELGDEPTLRRYFEDSEADIKLRLMAAAALSRKGDAGAMALIREARDGKDVGGFQIASWLLGAIGDPSDIEALRKRLDAAPTPIVRAYIENALAVLGDADGLMRLTRNLDDPDASVRTYAANFAGDTKATHLRAKLESLLDDSEPDVRVRAAQSLLFLFPNS